MFDHDIRELVKSEVATALDSREDPNAKGTQDTLVAVWATLEEIREKLDAVIDKIEQAPAAAKEEVVEDLKTIKDTADSAIAKTDEVQTAAAAPTGRKKRR